MTNSNSNRSNFSFHSSNLGQGPDTKYYLVAHNREQLAIFKELVKTENWKEHGILDENHDFISSKFGDCIAIIETNDPLEVLKALPRSFQTTPAQAGAVRVE